MDSQNRCAITSLLNDAPSSTNTSLKSSTNSSEISAISESSILSPLSDNSTNDIDIKKEHLEHIEHIENIKNFIKKEAKIDKNIKPEKIDCKWINCTRSFTDPQKLYDHLCDFHVGRKSNKNLSLSCKWDNCKTITSKRDHITSHLRVHIPLKPYSCNDCEKKFKRPQDLKKHKKTHINSEIKKRQKLFYEKLSLLTPIQKSEFIKSNFDFFENLDDNNNNNSNYNHNYQHIIKKENTLIYNDNNTNHNNSNAININNFNNNSQINYNAPPQYMNFPQNQSYTHLMYVPEKQHYQMIYPYQQFPQQQIIHFQPMMISNPNSSTNSNSSSHTSISNLNSISIPQPQPQQQLPHQQYNLQLPPTQSSHIQHLQHQYQQYTPIPAPAHATQQSYIHNAYPTHNANKFHQSI